MTAKPPSDLGDVLIVGGTGMLAGLTRRVAVQSRSLTLIARRPDALAAELGASPVSLDWTEASSAQQALEALRNKFDLVISWLHDDAVYLARSCEDAARSQGRSVRIHGSLSIDPAVRERRDPDPRPGIVRQTVILGWFADPSAEDGQRWLTDAEICEGVWQAVDDSSKVVSVIGSMND
jgi:hypothetical protein